METPHLMAGFLMSKVLNPPAQPWTDPVAGQFDTPL